MLWWGSEIVAGADDPSSPERALSGWQLVQAAFLDFEAASPSLNVARIMVLVLPIQKSHFNTREQNTTSSLKTSSSSSSSSSCLNLLARFANLAFLPVWKSSFKGLNTLAGDPEFATLVEEEDTLIGDWEDSFLIED